MHTHTLFISIDGMTDPLGQSQVIPYLEGLARQGRQITIISCEKKENFKVNEPVVRPLLEKAGIDWKYCFYSKKIPLLSQRGNMQRLKKLAVAETKNAKGKVIAHCRSYLAALVGLHLKKKYTAAFLFDMRGFWADERVEGGIWKLKNPLHKSAYSYFKRKEKELVANADHIITLTEAGARIVKQWNGSATKVSVIPCCTDPGHFRISTSAEKKAVREKLHIPPSAYVVGYLGSLGTWYMLDEMLDFFNETRRNKAEARFFIVTADNKQPILDTAKKKHIPANTLIIKAAGRKEVPAFISVFDVGLFFIRPTFSKKGSSPTKMAEILACGIPVITNAGVGDSDEIITRNKAGALVREFTETAYKEAIQYLEKENLSPGALRSIAEKNFSLEEGVATYEKVYRSLSR